MNTLRSRQLPVCLLLLLSAGCSSTISDLIKEPAEPEITVEEARRGHAALKGKEVRWGGEIIDVENKRQETWIEILAYPLSSRGRPDADRSAQSRFISRIRGFVDPAEYKAGRWLTVRGRLDGRITRPLGEYPYVYPLVEASAFHLWPKPESEEPWIYYPLHPWPYHPYDYYWWYRPRYRVHR